MSATTPSPRTPTRCPSCGEPFAFRVKERHLEDVGLAGFARCGREAGYVYLHQIEYRAHTPGDADALLDD